MRLDTPAVTPRPSTALRTVAPRPLRLRRSRSQILAALDGGGSVLQRRGRDVLVGSAILLIPLVALNLWATTEAFDRDGSTTLSAFGGDEVGTGIEDLAAMLVAVMASFAAALVGFFAASILIGDRFGRRITLWSAMRATVRRLPAILVAWALGHIWLPFFVVWALASPSEDTAARLFLVLPSAALLASATLLVIPVMVAERAGPMRSLRRSWRLAGLRFGSAFGFVIASALIGGLLLTGITLLPSLAEWSGFLTFGDYGWLAQGIAGQLGVIIVIPLIALGTAQMYLEVRLDAEGMDLALDADLAFGRRTGPA